MFKSTMRFLLLALSVCTFQSLAQAQVDKLKLSDQLAVDPQIIVGKLDNGLIYYIRENKKPENRAELRLAVNAGSILEDNDQRGLAHFVEHMAFNGTKNFAKHEIIDYLESIGMRFGADINAYTSFDETVYMLQVPTDSIEAVETGFEILTEWAHNVAFEEEEIDKERGVVIEEWRIGRGADARMLDKQFPVLFKDSQYAERLPIGKKEILENAPYEAFHRFYDDWYRPDLMAVVVVGDFDKAWIEKQIKQHFSGIPTPKDERKRKTFEVPDHKETLYTIATDVEATGNSISVFYKYDVPPEGTVGAYRQLILENLYNGMMNARLQELVQQEKPPYLGAYSGNASYVRTKEFYILGAGVADGQAVTGLTAVLQEARRVREFGFTISELERQKNILLRAMEQAYNERDKTVSRAHAAEYIRNFLKDEPIPGIEVEFELYKRFLPEITVDEVNALAKKWLRDDNRVVTFSGPDKEGVETPGENDLKRAFAQAEQAQLAAYEDKVKEEPLVAQPPTPGKVAKENVIEELGVTEWELSNGVKVVLKPTDFKNDQVLFTSFSPGGHSLVANANYVPALTASAIMRESGLGSFDQQELRKKLAGKIARVNPFIGELEEGIQGSAAPQDLETAFELIYLNFTGARTDQTAFTSFKNRIIGFIKNRHASPDAAFQDTIQVIMSSHHFRSRPWSAEVLQEMDLQKSYRIFQDRFADASDFRFVFVGNFEIETIKPLVEKYLGGLPNLHREESWKDVGIKTPKGVITKEVKKGLEPKSSVSIIFTGDMKWELKEQHRVRSMAQALNIKLREVLREDRGGTYGVGVSPSFSRYPREEYSLTVRFGCAPERATELTDAVFEQIDSLQTVGTTDKYLTKVKETQLRTRETDLKENGFWLNALRASYYHKSDPRDILKYDELVESLKLEDLQKAARKYFNTENYVQVVLYPEQS